MELTRRGKLSLSLALFACACAFSVRALEPPPLTGRVVDRAGILSQEKKSQIESYLQSLEESSGIQLAVLTVPSLEGGDIASFSIKVAQSWALGQSGKDNGALLVVAMREKKIRIEVGYGLEGKLTDTKCGLIIRNVISPKFQSGDFAGGIMEGVRNIGGVAADDEALVSKSVAKEKSGGASELIAALVFMFVFILFGTMVLPNIAGGRRWWLPWFFFSQYRAEEKIRQREYRRTHPQPPVGSGPSFGGGGFSGGGGHFGGGGASGGW